MNAFDLIASTLTVVKSRAATVLNRNRNADQKSVRFEQLAIAIQEVADVQRIHNDQLREMRDELDRSTVFGGAELSKDMAEVYKRLERAEGFTNGFEMARELTVALKSLTKVVVAVNAGQLRANARAVKIATLTTDLRDLEHDVAKLVAETRPAVERAAMKEADLDRWIDDATKGPSDDSAK